MNPTSHARSPSDHGLEARIQFLERRLARHQRIGACALVLALAGLSISALQGKQPKIIEADAVHTGRLIVQKKGGKAKLLLDADKSGSVLGVYDSKGIRSVFVGADKNGGSVYVRDNVGGLAVRIDADALGGTVGVVGKNKKAGTLLIVDSNGGRMIMTNNADKKVIDLRSSQGGGDGEIWAMRRDGKSGKVLGGADK
jgi:hypothetical protein